MFKWVHHGGFGSVYRSLCRIQANVICMLEWISGRGGICHNIGSYLGSVKDNTLAVYVFWPLLLA